MKPSVKWGIFLAIVTTTAAAAIITVKNFDRWFTIPKYHDAISASFKDPGSAQFRNDTLRLNGYLCGEVNSKNSYGAYVGFKKFVGNLGGELYLEGSGYVGKKLDAMENSRHAITALEAKNTIMRAVIDIRNRGGTAEKPSDSMLEDVGNTAIFNNAWKDYCEVDA